MRSPSWSTLLDFLDQPAVAIRVAERDETVVVSPPGIEARGLSFRSEVKRHAHVDSAIDKLSPRSLDVRRDQVHSLWKYETPNPSALFHLYRERGRRQFGLRQGAKEEHIRCDT
jgi:hypothetical protein